MKPVRVLIVEDNRMAAADLTSAVEGMGHAVRGVAASGEEAVTKALACRPDVILMDIRLSGDMDGAEAARRIRAEMEGQTAVIFLTAFDDRHLFDRAKSSEPYGYLLKPVEVRELEIAIELALYKLKSEAALKASEERFRTVADFTYNCETWRAPDGAWLYVSPACARVTGYSVAEIQNDSSFFEGIAHQDDRDLLKRHHKNMAENAHPTQFDMRIITRQGEERWISHSCQAVYGDDGRWLGRRASYRDITRRVRMQEALTASKKHAAMGVLAGGLAHDYNNLLYVITGYADMLKEAPIDAESREFVEEIASAALKAGELTRRLTAFSRMDEMVKAPASVIPLVRNAVIQALHGARTAFDISADKDVWPVNVDEGQMGQAIFNIAANAREAMADGGRIRITAENLILGPENPVFLPEGRYVRLGIADSGRGVPEADLDKIFDPYFSTKQRGAQKGVGLGLSAADLVVRRHDGRIVVQSREGEGARFLIYLPAAARPRKEAARDVRKAAPGKGKILVMDDDDMIRRMMAMLLKRLGYDCRTAENGEAALAAYASEAAAGAPFDAVALDLIVESGMGGFETLKELKKINAGVKAVLISSSPSDSPDILNWRKCGFAAALSKPCGIADISAALHDIMAP